MKIEDCFRVGTITKARGLKGELQLYVDYDGLDKIKFPSLFLDIAGKLVPFFVAAIKYPMANTAYLLLEDIDSVEKAVPLAKKDVYLINKLKPKKKKEEFTLKDLKGFIAVDADEGELGEITEVAEYPQQTIATVNYQGHEVLFPLNADIIKRIDTERGEVHINLPEGLIDVYLK